MSSSKPHTPQGGSEGGIDPSIVERLMSEADRSALSAYLKLRRFKIESARTALDKPLETPSPRTTSSSKSSSSSSGSSSSSKRILFADAALLSNIGSESGEDDDDANENHSINTTYDYEEDASSFEEMARNLLVKTALKDKREAVNRSMALEDSVRKLTIEQHAITTKKLKIEAIIAKSCHWRLSLLICSYLARDVFRRKYTAFTRFKDLAARHVYVQNKTYRLQTARRNLLKNRALVFMHYFSLWRYVIQSMDDTLRSTYKYGRSLHEKSYYLARPFRFIEALQQKRKVLRRLLSTMRGICLRYWYSRLRQRCFHCYYSIH